MHILWLPDAKNWLIGKDPDAGKRLKAGGEGATEMRWLGGVTNSMHMSWANSGRLWRTGKPGVLPSMGSQSDTTEQVNNNILLKEDSDLIVLGWGGAWESAFLKDFR